MENSKSINFILDNYTGLRKERALKLVSGHMKSSDEEFSKYVKNELVRARKEAIEEFRLMERLSEYSKTHRRNLKFYQETGDIVNAAEIELSLSEIRNICRDSEKRIATIGEYYIDMLGADILTEHEVCQILNINAKTWDKCKERYMNLCEPDENKKQLIYKVISIAGPEYRERKGRMKECYDCPDSEMPIYWAIHTHIMEAMKDNKEFNEASRNKFKELWPEIKAYQVTKDAEGNIIKMVEEK